MEVLRGHGFDRGELVDTGVVHEDVEIPELPLRLRKESPYILLLREIGLDGDRLPTTPSNVGDHLLGSARCIIDDDRAPARLPSAIRPQSLRCAGDDRDLPGELLRGGHDDLPAVRRIVFENWLQIATERIY